MNLKYTVNRIHCIHPFGISRSTHNYYDIVYVYIERDGIIGRGEAAPSDRYNESTDNILSVLKNGITLNKDMVKSNVFYEKLVPQCNGLKSLEVALSMALLDWHSQTLGIPLYQFFKADPEMTPLTSYTISIGNRDLIIDKIKESNPFSILKVKLGVSEEEDKETISLIREKTDKTIRVDANEGWDLETGKRMSFWLADRNVEFIEQPFQSTNLKDTASLRNVSPLPLIADENSINSRDIPSLVDVFDGINIKLMKCGNLYEALEMIKLARKFKMKIMLGCMIESSIAITAASHLSPLVDYADLDGNLLIEDDPYQGVTVKNGRLKLPKEHGLGVKLKHTKNKDLQ